MNLFKNIEQAIIKKIRKIIAKAEHVPFETTEWYNFGLFSGCSSSNMIICTDSEGNYITPPKLGELIIYQHSGKRYIYRVIGFKNENPKSDWFYSTDYIYVTIQYHTSCEFILNEVWKIFNTTHK